MSRTDTQRLTEIAAVLEDYFTAFARGDAEGLRRVFHPSTVLSSVVDGELFTLDLDSFIAAVTAGGRRDASAAERARIRGIHVVSSTCATAVVENTDGSETFADALSLVLLSSGWRIVHKSWARVETAR